MRQQKIINCYQIKLEQVVTHFFGWGDYQDPISGCLSERLEASTPDFKIHQKFSQYLTN